MQTVFINKVIVGAMAIFVMFNLSFLFKNNTIDAKIYRHDNNSFYGDLIIDDKKLPIVVSVKEGVDDGAGNEKTYNYNENKIYDENRDINENKQYRENKDINENKQYNEQKQHEINNNSTKKEEIINKNEQKIDNNTNSNINKKEDKYNENVKITDDKTPGSINIVIKNQNGEEIIINRDMVSKEMSEIDEKCYEKIVDGVLDYINKVQEGSIRKGVIEKVKGFKDYLNKPKNSRWLNWNKKE